MITNKINILLTGANGMVGEGVLHECLNSDLVGKVMILNRKPTGIVHAKLVETVQDDVTDLRPVATQLHDYDACFYCIGTTSMGKNESQYEAVTYKLTIEFAEALARINKNLMFSYISAAGADVSEQGKTMWARVKGKTENKLSTMTFAAFYSFRPLMLTPTAGMKHTHGFYKLISWLFPLGRLIFPNAFCTLKELGLAMIAIAIKGYPIKFIEVADIVGMAKDTGRSG